MTKEEIEIRLESQIEALKRLDYTTAYTGELGNVKENSYVLYSDVLSAINNKRKHLAAIRSVNKVKHNTAQPVTT